MSDTKPATPVAESPGEEKEIPTSPPLPEPAEAPAPDEPERKAIELSKEERRRMNVFLSNFSEAWVQSFRPSRISDEALVRFAIIHRNINVGRSIQVLPDGVTGSLDAKLVDQTTEKYFGVRPQSRSSYEGKGGWKTIRYVDGTYQFPMANGETHPFTHVVSVYELPDGLLEVDAIVYQPRAPRGYVDYYGSTIEHIRAVSRHGVDEAKRVHATLKRKRWDGRDTYELISYASITPDMNHGAYTTAKNPFHYVAPGHCTWFVWGRAYEKWGVRLPRSMQGDAFTWYDGAEGHFVRSQKPRADSIAVWKKGRYGHVAYVERVEGDTLILNEANWENARFEGPGSGYTGEPARVKKSDMATRYGTLLGYIYLTLP